ncbi:MAG: serine/threonine-protein kinase [Proteobacteria bacterium]|nr:serine/threonine-protein kinase [Pseudomonadota bacterium]
MGSGEPTTTPTQPGRAPADTPQRIVVRSHEGDSMMGAHDTAVATAAERSASESKSSPTRSSGGSPGVAVMDAFGGGTQPEIVGKLLAERYLITRKVGQGGMGAVYEATHTLINKKVAIKVLLEKYAQREAIVARLKKEAQLASSVRNEHIIDIADIGTTDDGRTFIVMEFLDGESLAECLARETRLPEQRILKIVSQVASALAAAHDKGVVHRDIKPENLFLLKQKDQDFVKVVDFGISKSLRASSEEEEVQRLTQTGMVLGTPLYMSPEQARGDDELDHRVDIYALGVIMYEAGTGRAPFLGNNYLSVISQVLGEDPKPLRELRPELSEEYEAIVLRAMAKDRKDRYKDATELLADITALQDDPTRSTERAKITGPRKRVAKAGPLRLVAWIAMISVIVAAIVVTVVMMMGPSKQAVGRAVLPIVPPVVVDAAVAPAIDAGPAEPAYETLDVKVETNPAGASIQLDGVDKCTTTPCTFPVVLKDRFYEGVAHIDGYNDKPFKFNPVEIKKNPIQQLTLTKPKGGATPMIIKKPPPTGSGSGAKPGAGSSTDGRTPGPDGLGGNPFGGATPKTGT